jgi:hypothetical protein
MLQMRGNEMFSEFGTVVRQGRFWPVDGLAKAPPPIKLSAYTLAHLRN